MEHVLLLWVKVHEEGEEREEESFKNTALVKTFKRNLMQFTFFAFDTQVANRFLGRKTILLNNWNFYK